MIISIGSVMKSFFLTRATKIIVLLPSSSVALFGTVVFAIVVVGREDVIASTDSVVGLTVVDTEPKGTVMEISIKLGYGLHRIKT